VTTGWSAPLSKPIKLKDGRMLVTLADARALILTLPELHQSNGHWQYAAELLLIASASKSRSDDALAQMLRALKAEGLL
jgi:hypothetical protein